MPVASPCIKLCVMDDAAGHCAGCFRTLSEIAAWSAMDDDARREVLKRIEARKLRASPEKQRS